MAVPVPDSIRRMEFSMESGVMRVRDPETHEVAATVPPAIARRVEELLRLERCADEYFLYLLISRTYPGASQEVRLDSTFAHIRDLIIPEFAMREPSDEVRGAGQTRIDQLVQLESIMPTIALPSDSQDMAEARRVYTALRFMFMRRRFGTALNCASFARLALDDTLADTSVSTLYADLLSAGAETRTYFARPGHPADVLSVGIVGQVTPSGAFRPFHAFLAVPSYADPSTPVSLDINGYCGQVQSMLGVPAPASPDVAVRYLSVPPQDL